MPKETFFNLPEEKRAHLLEILMDEFSNKDYKNVSVGRIAASAGIAKGSFYQYFADKKDCYLYLIQLGMDEKTAFLRQVPPPEHSVDMFAQLRWLLDVGIQFHFSNPRLARIGYKALFDDIPLPDETLQVIRRGSYAYFQQMIQTGIADGTLDPQIDADIAAYLLNNIFTNLGQQLVERFNINPRQLLSDGADLFRREEIRGAIDQVITILETGMRKKKL